MAAALPFPTVETKLFSLEPNGPLELFALEHESSDEGSSLEDHAEASRTSGASDKSKEILQVHRRREIEFNGLGGIAGVFRGRELTRKEGRLICGITPIDALIGGGIVRGRISEIIGDASAGKTTLAAAFAAAATGRGEVVAWLDTDGSFDPASTAAAGVDLARLLWVAMPVSRGGASYRTTADDIECQRGEIECGRPTLSRISGETGRNYSGPPMTNRIERGRPDPSQITEELAQEATPANRSGARYAGPPRMTERIEPDEHGQAQAGYRWSPARKRSPIAMMLKAAEWILTAGGFGLVVIDCGRACNSGSAFTQSAALRLARAAERSGAAVIVIGSRRLCGSFAALSLRLKRARICFSRESRWAPGLFDGLAIEAQVMRNKLGGAGASASWEALADPLSIWMSGATAESAPSVSAPRRTSGTKPAVVASGATAESAASVSAPKRTSGTKPATVASRVPEESTISESAPMRAAGAKPATAASGTKTRAAAAFDSSNLNGTLNAGRRAGMR
jgi:recombination protein RecA